MHILFTLFFPYQKNLNAKMLMVSSANKFTLNVFPIYKTLSAIFIINSCQTIKTGFLHTSVSQPLVEKNTVISLNKAWLGIVTVLKGGSSYYPSWKISVKVCWFICRRSWIRGATIHSDYSSLMVTPVKIWVNWGLFLWLFLAKRETLSDKETQPFLLHANIIHAEPVFRQSRLHQLWLAVYEG